LAGRVDPKARGNEDDLGMFFTVFEAGDEYAVGQKENFQPTR